MAMQSIGVRIGLEGGKEFADGLRGAAQEVKTYVAELKKAEGLKDPFQKASGSMTALHNAIQNQEQVVKEWRTQLDLAINKFGAFSPEASRFKEELTKAETKLQTFRDELQKLSNTSVEIKGLGTFKRDLETLGTAVSTFRSEFKQFESLSGLSNVFTKSSGMKSSLTNEIKAQEEYVKLLAEDYQKAARESGEFSERALEMRGKLAGATTELNNMRQELKELPNALQLAGDQLVTYGDKWREVGSKANEAARLFAPLSGIATAGLVGIGKTRASYEHNMKRIEAVLGVTAGSTEDLAAQMNDIDAAIMDMDSIYDKSEIAAGMEDIARAGFSGNDALKMLSATLNVATIEELDMSTAATGLAQSVKQFGDGAEDASRYADVLSATSAASATNVTELLQAMSQAAPAANAAGASVEDVALMLGLMANNGIVASRSGTAVKNIFANMIKPTDEAAGHLEKFNVSLFDMSGNLRPIPAVIQDLRTNFSGLAGGVVNLSDEVLDSEEAWEAYTNSLPVSDQERLAAIVEVFGKRALPGVLAVINTAEDKYSELASAIQNSSGAAQQMAEIIESSTYNQWKKLVAEIKALAIELGQVLLPIIKDVIGWAKEWIEKFRGMDDGTKKMIITTMGALALVAPVLKGVGSIFTGIGGLLRVGGHLVHGIGTVVGWGGKLLGIGKSVSTGITGVVLPSIGSLGTAIGGGAAGTAATGGIIGKLGGLAKAAGPFLLKGAVIVGAAAGVVWLGKKIYENWDEISGFLKKCWEGIKNLAKTIFEGIANVISKVWDGIKSAAKWAWDGITSMLSGIWNGLTGIASWALDGLSSIFSGAWQGIKNVASWAWDGITSMLSGIWSGFTGIASWALNGIGNVFSGAWQGIKNAAAWAWDGITSMLSGIWNGLTGIASWALDGVCNVFSKAWDFISWAAGGIGNAVSSAVSWGWDMLQGFGSGIKSGVGWVVDRVVDFGGWIADFLGFSVPEKGPLSDADKWMPDMMMLLANGIENNSWRVVDAASSLGTSVKDAMSTLTEAPEQVGSSFQNIGDNIAEAGKRIWSEMKTVAEQASTWGTDLTGNIASGIRGGITAVANAAREIAYRISDYLHHSTPDLGPLKDDDKWMLDMMKQFAQGIRDNIPLVKKAAEQAAAVMVPRYYAYLPETGMNSSTVSMGGVNFTINAQPGQDPEAIADVVEQRLIRTIERQQYAYS